eukprot:scaffold57429_cov27-Tisochrysis_lutea.AAC.6
MLSSAEPEAALCALPAMRAGSHAGSLRRHKNLERHAAKLGNSRRQNTKVRKAISDHSWQRQRDGV